MKQKLTSTNTKKKPELTGANIQYMDILAGKPVTVGWQPTELSINHQKTITLLKYNIAAKCK